MLKLSCWTLLVSFLLGSYVQALQLESACYYNLTTREHQDTDPNKKNEIASLSKILTSHWGLARLGLQHRFVTKVHVIPLGKNSANVETYDIHIEGGFDPVFSRDRLQYLVALLNNNKISNVRTISFDENFVFVDNLTLVASSDSFPHDPNAARTKNNVTQALARISNSYPVTRNRALKLYNMNLPESIRIKYSQVKYLPKAGFNAPSNERVIEIQSVPLKEILSEMNQHSNNHIADFLFQYLGSARGYKAFIQSGLNVDQQNFDVRNGSGNPIRDSEGRKFYNQASCSMIISTLVEIKNLLAKSDKGLESILATVGIDSDADNKSGLSTNYSSSSTDRAVIAKTGTIDPAIGLAGALLTKNGDILFSILYGTNGPGEWKNARLKILEDIQEVLQKNEARPMRTNDQLFLSFDNNSLKKP